ncbi:spore germination protein A1 [Peptococcaceae bacterium CEB3]|nr:spore germination protein A1 [Peptococcaceae bacterium CEB3]
MFRAPKPTASKQQKNVTKALEQPQETHRLSANLAHNLEDLRQVFDLCADIKFREFQVNAEPPISACVVHVANLVDESLVNDNVLRNLMLGLPSSFPASNNVQRNFHQVLNERLLSVTETQTTSDLIETVNFILNGNIALIIQGSDTAVIAMAGESKGRAVGEPETEPAIRGPRDGFVEDLGTNLSLVRRRIKSSRLKAEILQVGAVTKTKVAVSYVKGIVDDKLVEEVRSRLQKINVDAILGSSYIQEMISDEKFSLFPLIQYTERPDKVAGSLMEGRVAIFVDNDPMTLLAPTTFVMMLQASEDYYNEFFFASFIRVIRYIALNLTIWLPGVVVAIWSFHQELIPDRLLAVISVARQNLPFPIFVEVLGLELVFELLREAGVRLPKTVGQAVSIVGGLVIGEAAVNAGLVGPEPVVVVAMTAIASFAIPNYSAGTALRLLRFVLIILGGTLGFVGIVWGLMLILFHLCDLRSFGVPYLSPIAPVSPGDLKDTMVRFPWWAMDQRPRLFGAKEPSRQDPDQGPQKPQKEDKK